MSAAKMQLVRWSFPAFALLVGFFWYKRRRVDRLDPGGVIDKSITTDKNKEVCKTNTKEQKNNLNLYDSGIHIDESFTLNSSLQTVEEVVRSPRRVSESLDIPNRRSVSQAISIKSGSSNEPESWYQEVEDVPEPKVIILGSNPKSANFDMMSIRKPATLFEAERKSMDNKNPQVFENVTEEEEPTSNGLSKSSVYVDNRVSTVTECLNDCSQTLSNITMNDPKNEGQVICERDSANHSPVSAVLEGSVTDEVRSEGSTDSGKGGSINGHAQKINEGVSTYEFAIGQTLVGRLIGKRGSFLQQISAKAGVHIVIRRHPESREDKVCAIDGPPENISAALKLIRQKFPEKKFPQLSLEQITITRNPDDIPWVSELMYLSLVEGVNNDVTVCHIINPNRLFVQLPTHPTYPSLRVLDRNMTQLYDAIESPPVPDQLSKGMLVVAKWYNLWVRAYVENPDPNGQQNLVRLVDHGGYWTFSNAEMRKIRFDYLTLPFQAIEVFLAHVRPVGGEWCKEAYDVVAQVCSGSVAQAQIDAYVDSSVYVSLYMHIPKHGIISLADELIARGYAEPVTIDDIVPVHLP